MSSSSVSRRLITPKSWGKRDGDNFNIPARERVCRHCFHKGLSEVRTIAGQMFRCPRCQQLQF